LDIVEIERIKKAIERWGQHFIEHIFCEEEIEYVAGRSLPWWLAGLSMVATSTSADTPLAIAPKPINNVNI